MPPRAERLQLRISVELKVRMQYYATERGKSLSDLVEGYFRKLLWEERQECLKHLDAEQV